MKKFVFLLALGLFAADRAAADTVVISASGTGGNFDLVSAGSGSGNTATITFSDSFLTSINGGGITAAATVFGTFTIYTNPTTNGSDTDYGYDTGAGTVSEVITLPDGTATLTLTGASVSVDQNNTLTISGTLVLSSDTSSTYDFSQFTPGSTFTFSLNVPAPALFNTLIQTATSSSQPANYVTGTGSFSESDPAAVPEPSSLALLGLGSLGMVGFVWRRRSALIVM